MWSWIQIYLTKDQLSFIIDGIDFFNDDSEINEDYVSSDGKYRLTSEQINEFNQMLQSELKSMP